MVGVGRRSCTDGACRSRAFRTTLQNRAPVDSGVPHPVHAGVIDDPQFGQNRASAGAASPHVEQVIRHRVLESASAWPTALHDYAVELYSHSTVTTTDEAPASNQTAFVPRSARGVDPSGGPRRIRVGIIGATGYVGGELVRLLARHPNVELVGLVGRERDHDPIGTVIRTPTSRRSTSISTAGAAARPDAVFLALPHGTAGRHSVAATSSPRGTAIIDLGPGLPAARRRRLSALVRLRAPAAGPPRGRGLRLAGAPSRRARGAGRCPGRDRRFAGLLPDRDAAGAGAAGAGRADRRPRGRCQERRLGRGSRGQAEPAVRRGQRERLRVRHRWPPARRRDRAGARRSSRRARGSIRRANPGIEAVDFLPHLIPMTRGILSACHVRPTRAVDPGRARRAVRGGLRRRAVRHGRRDAARDEATSRGATTSGSTSASTRGPGGSSPSVSRTTW